MNWITYHTMLGLKMEVKLPEYEEEEYISRILKRLWKCVRQSRVLSPNYTLTDFNMASSASQRLGTNWMCLVNYSYLVYRAKAQF